MKVSREDGRIVLCFGPMEAEFLRRIVGSIIRQYRLKPEEVHPSVAEAWYSRRGCASAGLDAEQTREWIENLHELKSANVTALREWRRKLAARSNKRAQLELTENDAHIVLTVLNDHRLMCAARHAIGDEEMSMRSFTEVEQLRPRRRAALMDIMFLGVLIETILALLPGNYGDWPRYAE